MTDFSHTHTHTLKILGMSQIDSHPSSTLLCSSSMKSNATDYAMFTHHSTGLTHLMLQAMWLVLLDLSTIPDTAALIFMP